MKRSLQFLVAATVAFSAPLFAQSVPEITFDSNIDFLTLPAYGEVAGVATNSRGQIYVLARTGQPHDGAQRGSAAGAVAAQQGQDLALLHR